MAACYKRSVKANSLRNSLPCPCSRVDGCGVNRCLPIEVRSQDVDLLRAKN